VTSKHCLKISVSSNYSTVYTITMLVQIEYENKGVI